MTAFRFVSEKSKLVWCEKEPKRLKIATMCHFFAFGPDQSKWTWSEYTLDLNIQTWHISCLFNQLTISSLLSKSSGMTMCDFWKLSGREWLSKPSPFNISRDGNHQHSYWGEADVCRCEAGLTVVSVRAVQQLLHLRLQLLVISGQLHQFLLQGAVRACWYYTTTTELCDIACFFKCWHKPYSISDTIYHRTKLPQH